MKPWDFTELAPLVQRVLDRPVLRAYARISGGVIVNQDETGGVGQKRSSVDILGIDQGAVEATFRHEVHAAYLMPTVEEELVHPFAGLASQRSHQTVCAGRTPYPVGLEPALPMHSDSDFVAFVAMAVERAWSAFSGHAHAFGRAHLRLP